MYRNAELIRYRLEEIRDVYKGIKKARERHPIFIKKQKKKKKYICNIFKEPCEYLTRETSK